MPREECHDMDTANIHRSRRFGDPEGWQRKLEELGSNVLRDSSIGDYVHEPSPSPLFRRVDDYNLDFESIPDARYFDPTMFSERTRLRHMADGIIKNVQSMKDAEYCGGFLSILVTDKSRTNVATLDSILLSEVLIITGEIERTLASPDHSDYRSAISKCQAFLDSLGSAPNCELVNQVRQQVKPVPQQLESYYGQGSDGHIFLILSQIVLSILDLAILSYCGAHLEALHPDFPCIKEIPRLLLAPGLSLTQKKLRCLDKLLQSPVWIFEFGDTAAPEPESEDLWLSTTIEAFADVWGPVWPVTELEQPHEVSRFDVGGGSIFGWRRATDEPDVKDNEVFCHWVSASESRPPELCVGGELLRRELLIGGRLTVKEKCSLDPYDFTREMRGRRRLSDLGVVQGEWYTDTRTFTLSLAGLGIGFGGSETYKRRNELYRDALLTALEKNDFDYTLGVLRQRFVVEISACTGLARRQSILYALSSIGFKNYFEKSDMGWNDEERRQYFEMLRLSLEQDSLELIYDRLREPHFGDLIRKALKKSFCNVLLRTGRPGEPDLTAFWGFGRTRIDGLGSLLSYPSWDNSWTGLLREGSLGFNAAMVSPICLELHKRKHPKESLECAMICPNSNRYTLLETLLFVNDREPPKLPQGLELVHIENPRSYFAKRWSVREIEAGGVFHLGEQGQLTILKRMAWLVGGIRRSGLIAEWIDPEPSRLREMRHQARQIMGRSKAPCHCEHLGPDHGDRDRPEPIVTHIVSHPRLATG